MGYQTVEVKVTTGIRRATVYNADLLLWDEEPRTYLAEGVYQRLVKSADSVEARMIESIRVVQPVRQVREQTMMEKFGERLLGKPATEGEQKKTKQGDVFMRFTAYKGDRRITANKGLRPGTYATTEVDSRNVKTGEQAVERYALPDPKPAKYRFCVDPTKDTEYREGTVQPAYGHKGSGIEVLFDNGTSDNTVNGPTELPEK
ncbi:MAG: hypothetical protein GX616_10020 [Planctomycetes bacterium]|nr:hypothetical protein [Planctomycetota bacterium]